MLDAHVLCLDLATELHSQINSFSRHARLVSIAAADKHVSLGFGHGRVVVARERVATSILTRNHGPCAHGIVDHMVLSELRADVQWTSVVDVVTQVQAYVVV